VAIPESRPVINMLTPETRTIHLKDYTPPAFLISDVVLEVHLEDEDQARVEARLTVHRNPKFPDGEVPLILDGDELELEWVKLDGRRLGKGQYRVDAERLTIPNVPQAFSLETSVRTRPRANTKLMGLYASKDGFFTQCEPEGFRRITFFADRPDVMARYTTTIHADRARYPVLLSNGNRVAHGASGSTHWVKWEDPFPKPCYLFALVAARLDVLEDTYRTASGRVASLSIFVEPGKLDQCGFAMQALKKSMQWDEQVFGLELDLDHYMIVAVGDFNMGAMENKGLNIFNTKYVLARPDIATDTDFMLIDRVVAHEYFHNWTGNRVTCRDWFQLSLKEGLTVFRDQEFGADMYSRPVQRIQEVRGLRAAQFPEDAGPMAHPVRPQSYMEISNFYTATVYEKGAEVVRMIHTLIGASAFRKGMDLYFQRHDGQAVTTDDFVQAMQDASGVDLARFKRWYDQAGTPRVEASGHYDAAARRFELVLRQSTPPTPGQTDKQPLHIPFAVGLLDGQGHDLPLQLQGEDRASGTTRVLSLREAEQRFSFDNVPSPPVPSLLRGFSAPVQLRYDYSDADLAHLMACDSDAVNRWEAGQRLALAILLRGISARTHGAGFEAPAAFVAAFGRVLADAAHDPAFTAEALGLPSEGYVGEQMEVIDPDAIHAVRRGLRVQLAAALQGELLATYQAFAVPAAYSPDARSAGQRAIKNACLSYLMELDDEVVRALCLRQFETADNMTDAMAALAAIVNSEWPERSGVLERFYDKWQHEPLVVDKWLAVQAGSRLPDTLAHVRGLTAHPAFDLKNPNKVYALIRTFCTNQVRFHAADGGGYAFAADHILALDPLNPQVAARLARSFDRWKKFDQQRQAQARAQLERIRAAQGLSKDTLEVVTKALA
jgi:aminopeptidase N